MVVKYFQDRFVRPVIEIDDHVTSTTIALRHSNGSINYLYIVNRITVRNTGRTAAKECKAYSEVLDIFGSAERTGWMLPDKNSGYTVKLNVKDHEYIDFCAIAVDEQQGLLITTERGFSEGTIESCRIVPSNRPEFVIRVTSSTAAPCERTGKTDNYW